MFHQDFRRLALARALLAQVPEAGQHKLGAEPRPANNPEHPDDRVPADEA